MLKVQKKYRVHSQRKVSLLLHDRNINISKRECQNQKMQYQNSSNIQRQVNQSKYKNQNKNFAKSILKQHNNAKHQQKGLKNQSTILRSKQIYQKLRLDQNITFLQAKVQNQYKQISSLTQELSTCIQLKENIFKSFQIEKDKSEKLKKLLQTSNKKLLQTYKKLKIFQQINIQCKQKRSDDQYKLNKLRQILKKKQQIIAKLQESVISKGQQIKQRQCHQKQLLALRTNYIMAKSKQQQFREQIDRKSKKLQNYKNTIQQLKKDNLQKQNKIDSLEDQLQKFISKLEIVQQCRKEEIQQNQKIEYQYQQIVQKMNAQLFQLRKENQLLTTIRQNQNCVKLFSSDEKRDQLLQNKTITARKQSAHSQIYINEIQRIVNDVKDKKNKFKIVKQMTQLFEQIQNGWKKTLIGMIQKQTQFPLTEMKLNK